MEALQIADGFPGRIHLLLTDVIMPHMNGRELDEDVAFIEKTFTHDALGRKIRRILDFSASAG